MADDKLCACTCRYCLYYRFGVYFIDGSWLFLMVLTLIVYLQEIAAYFAGRLKPLDPGFNPSSSLVPPTPGSGEAALSVMPDTGNEQMSTLAPQPVKAFIEQQRLLQQQQQQLQQLQQQQEQQLQLQQQQLTHQHQTPPYRQEEAPRPPDAAAAAAAAARPPMLPPAKSPALRAQQSPPPPAPQVPPAPPAQPPGPAAASRNATIVDMEPTHGGIRTIGGPQTAAPTGGAAPAAKAVDKFALPKPADNLKHESTGSHYFNTVMDGKKPVASISQYLLMQQQAKDQRQREDKKRDKRAPSPFAKRAQDGRALKRKQKPKKSKDKQQKQQPPQYMNKTL